MANQMIALQARVPSTNVLGGAIQQNAQMINMLTQQKAAERQAAQAQQKMALDAELAQPQLAKAKSDAQSAQLKVVKDFMDTSAFGIANARNAQDALRVGEILKAQFNDPVFHQAVDQTLASIPQNPAEFEAWRTDALMRTMEASKQLEYRVPKVKSEVTYDLNGGMHETRTGGMLGGEQGVYPLQSYRLSPQRGGQVEMGEQTTVNPATAPASTAPMMPGATASNVDLDLLNVAAGVRNEDEYQVWMGMLSKAYPDFAAQLKQVAPSYNPEQMKSIVNAAAEALGAQPAGGGVGGPDIAVAGGAQGGPYEPTGQQAYGKSPMLSPMPGSAIVPLPRLAAEKTVETRAQKGAELEAELTKSKMDQRRAAQNFLKVTGVDTRTGKDPVAALIKKSTSGAVEAVGAEFMGALPEMVGGGATPGAEAIGELETIAATITNNLLGGKLGTGISNEDRKMIERMVGDIANPYIPAGKRLAAWNRVKQIQMSYLNEPSSGAPKKAGSAPRRTPTNKPNIDALLKKYGD